MKKYTKPEITLSHFDADIIATSGSTLSLSDTAYKVDTAGAEMKIAENNSITIDIFNK